MCELKCILIVEIGMELYFCNRFAANLNMKGISFFLLTLYNWLRLLLKESIILYGHPADTATYPGAF